MRYANQLRLRDRIQTELPSATVKATYDGPSGYILVVAGPHLEPVTIKSDADWRRLHTRIKRVLSPES
jgi:hypothetical protein